jgi:site-specific recombinase XerD
MRMFLAWIYPRTSADITDGLIKAYQLYLADQRKVSISTQNTAINAIKFYLEKVHHGERKVYYVDRPMKEFKLPRVLSQQEVKALIEVTQNPKHRCMLLVMYSSGLRISELLNLRSSDFDEERLQLFVNGGKGKKDRITLLSKAALEYTRFYTSLYHPKEFLFEGPGGKRYSPRSLNQIVHRSAALAGIQKRVSPHTLRHSFATHLMENFVDTRYIQALMGHDSIKTTERYTHVTTKGFSQIKSPLEGLNIDFKIPKQIE